MKEYKLFLFDFDYTLIDSSKGIASCINYGFEKMNYPLKSPQEISCTIGQSLQGAFSSLSGDNNLNNYEKFKQLFMEQSKRVMAEYSVIYEGTIEALKFLKENDKKVGIVSAKDHATIKKIAERFNFLQYVDLIVGEDDVVNQKPDPEALNKAINDTCSTANQTIYVGDSVFDAEMATNAKIDFLPILGGVSTRIDFERFEKIKVLSVISEIKEFV